MPSVHIKVLRKAAQAAGGYEELAAHLSVPAGNLRRWAAGEGVLPIPVFLKAIDLALGEEVA